jgi:ELWxxDGT repeat protein
MATNDGMGSELFRLDDTGLEKMSSTLGNSPGQYMGLNLIGGVVIFDAPLTGSPDLHLLAFDNNNLTLFNMNPALSSPGMSGGAIVDQGTLYFDCDSTSGTEMCSSDGTPSGTKVLADVMTGAADSDPRDIMVVAGEVVALAKGWNGSANIGYALYSFSDTGATLLWDPQPGVGDSQAGLYGQIIRAGDFLYFVAEDGTYGQELHAFAHGELSNSWIVLD